MKMPLVSVLITTRNSARTLGALLESIRKQTYRKIEIVVVDNASSDGTGEIARKFTKKVYGKGPERSAQRNFAARKAEGKYLLVLDADMVLTRDVVKGCVEKLEEDSVAAVVIPEKSFGEGYWARVKAFEREINEGESYFVAARFFRKKVFEELGGYDENLTGPEDWELPQRMAKKHGIGRVSAKILHNEGRPTLVGLAKRKYYYGLSVHKYLTKHKMPVVGPTTVYFLRPAFYRKWRVVLSRPVLMVGLFVMLFAETVGGGAGYLVGRFRG